MKDATSKVLLILINAILPKLNRSFNYAYKKNPSYSKSLTMQRIIFVAVTDVGYCFLVFNTSEDMNGGNTSVKHKSLHLVAEIYV